MPHRIDGEAAAVRAPVRRSQCNGPAAGSTQRATFATALGPPDDLSVQTGSMSRRPADVVGGTHRVLNGPLITVRHRSRRRGLASSARQRARRGQCALEPGVADSGLASAGGSGSAGRRPAARDWRRPGGGARSTEWAMAARRNSCCSCRQCGPRVCSVSGAQRSDGSRRSSRVRSAWRHGAALRAPTGRLAWRASVRRSGVGRQRAAGLAQALRGAPRQPQPGIPRR